MQQQTGNRMNKWHWKCMWSHSVTSFDKICQLQNSNICSIVELGILNHRDQVQWNDREELEKVTLQWLWLKRQMYVGKLNNFVVKQKVQNKCCVLEFWLDELVLCGNSVPLCSRSFILIIPNCWERGELTDLLKKVCLTLLSSLSPTRSEL